MIGDSSNSFFLKDILQISFLPINRIQITLRDKTIQLRFAKRSISHGIDQVASILFDTPFEAGSWQEEVASFTAHWASVLTTALLLRARARKLRSLSPTRTPPMCVCGG